MLCSSFRLAVLLSIVASGCRAKAPSDSASQSQQAVNGLRSAESFAALEDSTERSRALFTEAAKVLLHPRCVNCHPADGQPRQGDHSIMHSPPIWSGDDGRGVAAMECVSCHQASNYNEQKMPGAKDWHLAPSSMVFLGRNAAQVCAGLKDPKRNGGRTIEKVVEHVAHDGLVAWGFAPGVGRNPAPGTQPLLAGLLAAWA